MYYYKQVRNKAITSIESKSVDAASPGFVRASKKEYETFIVSLPVTKPEPARDLTAEIDAIKTRLAILEQK